MTVIGRITRLSLAQSRVRGKPIPDQEDRLVRSGWICSRNASRSSTALLDSRRINARRSARPDTQPGCSDNLLAFITPGGPAGALRRPVAR